jgi:mycothiol synthase
MNALLVAKQSGRPADDEFIVDLYQATARANGTEPLLTAADLHAWLTHPETRSDQDFFVAEVGGQPAGFVGLMLWRGTRAAHRLFARGAVHPSFRRRGLGRALLQAAEARARLRRLELPTGLACYFDIGCRSPQPANVALYQSLGFALVRRFHRMVRDLRQPLPSVSLPPGFVLRPWELDADAALLAAHNEAFADHWSDEPVPPEQWLHFRDVPYFRPDLWHLAWTAVPNEPAVLAGFCLNFISPDHQARMGRLEGMIDEIGVLPAFQRRGLATALLAHTLHTFQAAGQDSAVLVVDTDNVHQAPRFYARAGFTTASENLIFRKAL